MEQSAELRESHTGFAIVFIIGAPGAGKGTISTHLAKTYNLAHYSVGDGLRAWMRENHATALAAEIQSKLDNQGFLSSETLNPFIYRAILNTITSDESGALGIVIDGYPRCIEQLDSLTSWPFRKEVPLTPGNTSGLGSEIKPDVVLSLEISKQNAKERYLGRARDTNDNADKFEKRFAEYKLETAPVEKVYRQRGILISLDANGSKEESIEALTRKLQENEVWQRVILNNSSSLVLK